MSISSEITRISNAKTAIAESIANKGVTVPSGTKIDGMAALIDSIQTGGGGGDTSETWVMNPVVTIDNTLSVAISFTSNGQSFSLFHFDSDRLKYDDTSATSTPDIGSPTVAMKLIYRKVTFATAPTGDLLTWLQSNAVKQADDTAVQPSKTLTVTSNGTTTITPDIPYDAIKQVDLTVNVSSSELATVTISIDTAIDIMYYDAVNKQPVAAFLAPGPETIKTFKNTVVGVFIDSHGYAGITNKVGCSSVEYFSSAAILITDSTASFRVFDDS